MGKNPSVLKELPFIATSQNLFCYWKVSEALLFWDMTISRLVNDYWAAVLIPLNLMSQNMQF